MLEGPDPGQMLIDYARNNPVDHILIGARGYSTTPRTPGSLSSRVVAEAPRSVTLIRLAADRRTGRDATGVPGAEAAQMMVETVA